MTYNLLHGDNRLILPTLSADSFDSCVTDPPYELGFMGRKWDSTGIANDPMFWAEVYRVLKPGAHLLAFSGTRTYHRMVCAIEDAGFEIRDQIQWIFSQGFPKSHNVGASIDKLQGAAGNRGHAIATASREQPNGQPLASGDDLPAYEPVSADAQPWAGFGTALKPANEPICVARKPLSEKNVAANVLKHGCGAINVDGCRIGDNGGCAGAGARARVYGDGLNGTFATPVLCLGRWPSNVIVDVGVAEMLDEQSGILTSGNNPSKRSSAKFTNTFMGFVGQTNLEPARFSDTGGASRFFYCAKADQGERNHGCGELPAKASGMVSNTSGQHITRRDGGAPGPRGNHHPTVKPVDLMRYLVRLVTRPGGHVLDPFMGSGSTGVGCIIEGMRFTGIEMSEEYIDIARARMDVQHPNLFMMDLAAL